MFENSNLVLGEEIMLYLYTGATAASGDVLAFATSCSLQVATEAIDASSKLSGRWQNNIAGRMSYTISSDALYTDAGEDGVSYKELFELMLAHKPVKWAMYRNECQENGDANVTPGTLIRKGEALINSLDLTAGNNEVSQCSISLTGCGKIETTA